MGSQADSLIYSREASVPTRVNNEKMESYLCFAQKDIVWGRCINIFLSPVKDLGYLWRALQKIANLNRDYLSKKCDSPKWLTEKTSGRVDASPCTA